MRNRSAIDRSTRSILTVSDFYSLSECRDLLFHVNERHFSPLSIATLLDDVGLEFLGFEFADSDTLMRFESLNNDLDAKFQLDCWNTFEESNPDTFFRMYVFWVRKK